MSYNTSSAYDLSMYQQAPNQQAPNRQPHPQLQVVQKRSAKRTLSFAFTPRALGAFAIVVTLVSLMVYNQVCLTEISRDINLIQKDLTQLESEYVKMKSQMEAMASLQSVAERAKNDLGLHRLDKYQTQYINLYGKDKSILTTQPAKKADEQNKTVATTRFIDRVMEYIAG